METFVCTSRKKEKKNEATSAELTFVYDSSSSVFSFALKSRRYIEPLAKHHGCVHVCPLFNLVLCLYLTTRIVRRRLFGTRYNNLTTIRRRSSAVERFLSVVRVQDDGCSGPVVVVTRTSRSVWCIVHCVGYSP